MSGTDSRRDGCGGCSVEGCSARVEPSNAPLRGATLTLAAVFVFLVPVILAIAGAVLAGPGAEPRSLGAFGGLLLGMVLTALAVHRPSPAGGTRSHD